MSKKSFGAKKDQNPVWQLNSQQNLMTSVRSKVLQFERLSEDKTKTLLTNKLQVCKWQSSSSEKLCKQTTVESCKKIKLLDEKTNNLINNLNERHLSQDCTARKRSQFELRSLLDEWQRARDEHVCKLRLVKSHSSTSHIKLSQPKEQSYGRSVNILTDEKESLKQRLEKDLSLIESRIEQLNGHIGRKVVSVDMQSIESLSDYQENHKPQQPPKQTITKSYKSSNTQVLAVRPLVESYSFEDEQKDIRLPSRQSEVDEMTLFRVQQELVIEQSLCETSSEDKLDVKDLEEYLTYKEVLNAISNDQLTDQNHQLCLLLEFYRQQLSDTLRSSIRNEIECQVLRERLAECDLQIADLRNAQQRHYQLESQLTRKHIESIKMNISRLEYENQVTRIRVDELARQ